MYDYFSLFCLQVREPIRMRVTTKAPYMTTTTSTTTSTTISTTMAYRFKKPEEVVFNSNTPCSLKDLCDVTEKNYPL